MRGAAGPETTNARRARLAAARSDSYTNAASTLPFCTAVSAARTLVDGTIFGSQPFPQPADWRYCLA